MKTKTHRPSPYSKRSHNISTTPKKPDNNLPIMHQCKINDDRFMWCEQQHEQWLYKFHGRQLPDNLLVRIVIHQMQDPAFKTIIDSINPDSTLKQIFDSHPRGRMQPKFSSDVAIHTILDQLLINIERSPTVKQQLIHHAINHSELYTAQSTTQSTIKLIQFDNDTNITTVHQYTTSTISTISVNDGPTFKLPSAITIPIQHQSFNLPLSDLLSQYILTDQLTNQLLTPFSELLSENPNSFFNNYLKDIEYYNHPNGSIIINQLQIMTNSFTATLYRATENRKNHTSYNTLTNDKLFNQPEHYYRATTHISKKTPTDLNRSIKTQQTLNSPLFKHLIQLAFDQYHIMIQQTGQPNNDQ